VAKSFKQVYAKDVELPVVLVRLSDTASTRLQIGANTLDNRYLLIIDVFNTSDGMRLDLSDYLLGKLKDGWVHYDHSHASGGAGTLDRSANGRDMVVDFLTNQRIDFGDTVDTKDKYRQTLSLRIRTSAV